VTKPMHTPPALPESVPAQLTEQGMAYVHVWSWRYCETFCVVRYACAHTGRKTIRPYHREESGKWRAGLPPGPRPLYGAETLPVSPADVAYIVEGEKCAAALHGLGWACVTSGSATSAGKADWTPLLKSKTLVILPDNDAPGEAYVRDVANALAAMPGSRAVSIARLPGLSDGGDVCDWLKARVPTWDEYGPIPREPGDDLANELQTVIEEHSQAVPVCLSAPAETGLARKHKNPTALVTTRASEIMPESVSWLWPGRLPLGKVVVLDGDPGVGKSTITMDIAARISTGAPFPGCEETRAARNVLLMSAEDGAADTVRPRLDACGADTSHVHVVKIEEIPSFPEDLSLLEAHVLENATALIVIDPLMAFLGAKTDSHRDQDIRKVLGGLAGLAEKANVTILIVRHLNKTSNGSATYRGGGSIGIIGAARVGLLAAQGREQGEDCVLAVVKSNLAAMPAAIYYKLISGDGCDVAHVEWGGAAPYTANELVREPEAKSKASKKEEAEAFITESLQDGPIAVAEMEQRAQMLGITAVTLKRAKQALRIESRQTGNPKAPGPWLWELPRGS
jgi:putative DNA primase/helicase